MVKLKRWKEEILMKAGVLLAVIGVFAASLAANGACVFPFFEPEQPKELKKMNNKYSKWEE